MRGGSGGTCPTPTLLGRPKKTKNGEKNGEKNNKEKKKENFKNIKNISNK